MKMRLAGWIEESIVDGPGLRLSVFAQGCPHQCPGCHNPQTHDAEGGSLVEGQRILDRLKANPLLAGVTLSGGEPLMQAEAMAWLAEETCKLGKDVVLYTGYTYEELRAKAQESPEVQRLLACTRLLIDGRFEIKKKSLTLLFRGSSNQRIVDVQASLQAEEAVLWQPSATGVA